MPTIDVQTEQERPGGWTYRVVIHHDTGPCSEHTVTLAWVDHDHWSGGRLPPSVMVQRVIEYLFDQGVFAGEGVSSMPAAFDAARARRWRPEIDQELRAVG